MLYQKFFYIECNDLSFPVSSRDLCQKWITNDNRSLILKLYWLSTISLYFITLLSMEGQRWDHSLWKEIFKQKLYLSSFSRLGKYIIGNLVETSENEGKFGGTILWYNYWNYSQIRSLKNLLNLRNSELNLSPSYGTDTKDEERGRPGRLFVNTSAFSLSRDYFIVSYKGKKSCFNDVLRNVFHKKREEFAVIRTRENFVFDTCWIQAWNGIIRKCNDFMSTN